MCKKYSFCGNKATNKQKVKSRLQLLLPFAGICHSLSKYSTFLGRSCPLRDLPFMGLNIIDKKAQFNIKYNLLP